MEENQSKFWQMLTNFDKFWQFLKNFNKYLTFRKYQKTLTNVYKFKQTLWNVFNQCWQRHWADADKWQKNVNKCQMTTKVMKFWQMLGNVNKVNNC